MTVDEKLSGTPEGDEIVRNILGWCGKHLKPIGLQTPDLEDNEAYINARAFHCGREDSSDEDSADRCIKRGSFGGRIRSKGSITSD